jgi:hypothetical protein
LARLFEWFGKRQQERRDREESEAQRRRIAREQEAQIHALPIEEARRIAESLLANPKRWDCSLVDRSLSDDEQAASSRQAPLVREFFLKYAEVAPVAERGRHQLTGEFEPIKDSDGNELFVIGRVDADGDYVVKPGDESIYYEDESPQPEFAHPSIYHAVICIDRLDRIWPEDLAQDA